jgi:nucleoid DNA-binding protein
MRQDVAVRFFANELGVSLSSSARALKKWGVLSACELQNGGTVPVFGLGRAKTSTRAARGEHVVRNPRTGEVLYTADPTPETKSVKLVPSLGIKRFLNTNYSEKP